MFNKYEDGDTLDEYEYSTDWVEYDRSADLAELRRLFTKVYKASPYYQNGGAKNAIAETIIELLDGYSTSLAKTAIASAYNMVTRKSRIDTSEERG